MWVPLDLLRCDVRRRPNGHVLSGHGLRLAEAPAEPEVGKVNVLSFVEQDVGGLHVAVHQPARMGYVERVRDLGENRDRAGRIECSLDAEELLQVAALDEAHDEIELSFDLAGAVHRDDVRVLEGGCKLRLGQEPGTEAGIGRQLRRDELHGDFSLELNVVGEADEAHPAAAEKPLDPITGQLTASLDIWCQHRGDLPPEAPTVEP